MKKLFTLIALFYSFDLFAAGAMPGQDLPVLRASIAYNSKSASSGRKRTETLKVRENKQTLAFLEAEENKHMAAKASISSSTFEAEMAAAWMAMTYKDFIKLAHSCYEKDDFGSAMEYYALALKNPGKETVTAGVVKHFALACARCGYHEQAGKLFEQAASYPDGESSADLFRRDQISADRLPE